MKDEHYDRDKRTNPHNNQKRVQASVARASRPDYLSQECDHRYKLCSACRLMKRGRMANYQTGMQLGRLSSVGCRLNYKKDGCRSRVPAAKLNSLSIVTGTSVQAISFSFL